MTDNCFYEFGPFRLDQIAHQLLRNGEPVPLTPKAFSTLLVLVSRRGRILGKDELMREVWPDTFVEEGGLARNISVLRKALDDTSDASRYIETIPKIGYRFVADVKEVPEANGEFVLERYARTNVVTLEEIDTAATAQTKSTHRFLPGTRMFTLGLVFLSVGLALAFAYRWSSLRSNKATVTPKTTAIAILPFKQLGSAKDQFQGLAMADALITKLENLNQVSVLPTSAVRRYVGSTDSGAELGRELGVDAVLEGNVQQTPDGFRVTVQLVKVADGASLWAAKFDEKSTDILAVQDSISEQVARALTPKLSEEDKRRITKHYTDNADAYNAYTKGRVILEKKTVDEANLALRYFQEAIDKDPNYALAYTGLADAYYTLGASYPALAYSETMAKSRMAAEKAIELDDSLAEAHLSLALVKFNYDWDWPAAEKEFNRAIELNPKYTPAHHEFSHYWMAMGRVDKSLEESHRALELEPLSVKMNVHLAWHYLVARQYDEAISQCKKTLEMSPNYIRAHHFMGIAYLQKSMYAEGIQELQKAVALKGDGVEAVASLGYAYAISGRKKDALRILRELQETSRHGYVSPFDRAVIYAGLGDKDQAFYWLNRAYEERNSGLAFLKTYAQLDSLRSDPRFSHLIKRVGLPE